MTFKYAEDFNILSLLSQQGFLISAIQARNLARGMNVQLTSLFVIAIIFNP